MTSMENLAVDLPKNENPAPCRSQSMIVGDIATTVTTPKRFELYRLQTMSTDTTHSIATMNTINGWENVLYIVTEMILVICGLIIVVSCALTFGVAILGISRTQKGLDYYTKSYHDKWENVTFHL